MTQKELLEIKKILGIEDLKADIKDLSKDIKSLNKRLNNFWYKIAFIFLTMFISFIIYLKLG